MNSIFQFFPSFPSLFSFSVMFLSYHLYFPCLCVSFFICAHPICNVVTFFIMCEISQDLSCMHCLKFPVGKVSVGVCTRSIKFLWKNRVLSTYHSHVQMHKKFDSVHQCKWQPADKINMEREYVVHVINCSNDSSFLSFNCRLRIAYAYLL